MDAGWVNDNEEDQLMPGYGTITIGKVRNDYRTIVGDNTSKGRQRYIIYVPKSKASCEENLAPGTRVMFDVAPVKVVGLDFPPISVAVNVRPFDPKEWGRLMEEMDQK